MMALMNTKNTEKKNIQTIVQNLKPRGQISKLNWVLESYNSLFSFVLFRALSKLQFESN